MAGAEWSRGKRRRREGEGGSRRAWSRTAPYPIARAVALYAERERKPFKSFEESSDMI